MYFVYLLTTLITTFHLINVFQKQVPLRKKTFLDIPILLFFISQLISTYYSIDPHTSFFGYYSRLNGGLLSLICYIILFFILSVYIDSDFKNKIINFSLFSAFLISIYAIAQAFGIDKNLWVQDVQSRVFSTFGQPNWLAAYLCILIPFSIFKFFESIKLYGRATARPYFYLSSTIIFYIAILFTKSKSGIIACLISLTLYFIIYFFQTKPFAPLLRGISLKKGNLEKDKTSLKKIFIFALIFILLTFTINNPIKDYLFPSVETPRMASLSPTNNSESSKILITSSGDIRKIVWKGAIDLWKKFPIFGTGVETFAYSYYWTRPVKHNLTSEWDFLYNKAHNEYINYLATTGTIGFLTYCFFIISVLFFSIKSPLSKGDLERLNLVVLSSFSSILITNFAGFSVVITSLFFFLLPALLNPNQEFSPPKSTKTKFNLLIIPLLLISFFFLKKTISFYLADIAYNQSEKYDSQNDYQTALSFAQASHQLNPNEPLYTDKLATIYSKIALSTGKQEYVDQAINYSDLTIKISPANINFWKQRAQDYLYLSGIDTKYFSISITALTNAASLAPTDAKIPYSLGQFLETASLTDQAIPYYQKAIELKSNYDYAYFALGKIYLSQKKYDLAQQNLQKTIDYSYPTNQEAKKLLESLPSSH